MTPDEVAAIVRQELKAALGNDYAGANPAKVVPAGPPSSRAATKVRDMDGGTAEINSHVLSANTTLRTYLAKGGK